MILLVENDRFIPYGLKMLKREHNSINAALIVGVPIGSQVDGFSLSLFYNISFASVEATHSSNYYDEGSATTEVKERGYDLNYLSVIKRRRSSSFGFTNFLVFGNNIRLFRIFDKKSNMSVCFNYSNTKAVTPKLIAKAVWNTNKVVSNTPTTNSTVSKMASTVIDLHSQNVLNSFALSNILTDSSNVWSREQDVVTVKCGTIYSNHGYTEILLMGLIINK